MKRRADSWWRGGLVGLVLAMAPCRAHAQLLVAEGGTVGAASAPATAKAGDDDDFVDEYATTAPVVADPFERVNRTIFKFNSTAYKFVLRPVSRGYETVVPGPARRGLHSFFDNLHFPVRFANCVLQGKFERAAAETGKFALNSTVGLAGFIKVSDRYAGLRVPDEDLGQTFGRWGIGHGPFLILPVLGPSSLRDGIGRIGDYYATPTHWQYLDHFDRWVAVTLQAGDIITALPDVLANQDALQRAAVDPYLSFRHGYIEYRNGEVEK